MSFMVVNRGLRIRCVAMRVLTGRQRLLKHHREQFCVPGLERMWVPVLEAMCVLSRVLMSDRGEWCGRRFRMVLTSVCEGSKELNGVRRERPMEGEMKRRLILPQLNLRNHPAQTPRPALNHRAPNPAPNHRAPNPVPNHRAPNRRAPKDRKSVV